MILNSPYISGSLTVTGNIIASGSITLSGSVASASFAASATSASYALNATTASFATRAITASYADALTVAGTLTAQTLVVQTITSSVDFVTGSTRFGTVIGNTHTFTGSMSVSGSAAFTSGLINGTTDAFFDLNRSASGNASRIRFQTTGSDEFEIGLKGGVAGFHITKGDATELVTVLTSGNVGVNTLTPNAKFEVNGYGTANSIMTYVAAKFYGAGTGGVNIGTDGTVAMIATDSSDADMQFLTRVAGVFSPRITIKSGGNVNIGNATSAAYGLTGDSNLATNMGITFHNNTAGFSKVGAIISVQESGGSHAMALYTRSGGDEGERIRITSGGDLEFKGRSTTTNFQAVFYNANDQLAINATNTSTGKTINLNPSNTFTALSLSATGAATFSSTVRATRFEVTPSGTFRVNTDGDAILGYMLRSGAWKGNTENNLALATDGAYGISFFTNGSASERMFIAPSGNVGIGTSNPQAYGGYISLTIGNNAANSVGLLKFRSAYNSGNGAEIFQNTSGTIFINTNGSQGSMSITSAGYVWINGNITNFEQSAANFQINGFSRVQQMIFHNGANTAQAVSVACNGADSLNVAGAFSANSKSFLIPHPLANLESTHNLRYVSVESPQADLIYRGKLTLVNGKAQANIDEAATMTEGTFEALCREIQCFTTNESGWDLVKGKVIGNIIYIESQNINSTDEISWMVIGERKDKHMMDTSWTDENGKVIVEPLKQIETVEQN
jgi:hypothetical protein